jgi:hypothetical protein
LASGGLSLLLAVEIAAAGGRENAGVEGVQRIVLAAPRPESVGEPEAAFRLSGTLRRASTA